MCRGCMIYTSRAFGDVFTRTEAQCVDMLTKSFRELPKWLQAIRLIGIGKPGGRLCMPLNPALDLRL